MSIKQQCPICFGPLEERDVAPCYDCGDDPKEINEFINGEHEYSEWEIFPGLTAVLCNFCDVDFASYDPTYFGLPRGERVSFEKMHFLRKVDIPALTKDGYCPECNRRLAFLNFVASARDINKGSNR